MRYELRERTVIDIHDTEADSAVTTFREEHRSDAEAEAKRLEEQHEAATAEEA